MLLTVCLFKPRTWNHSLAKIVRKLLLSDLTLVGLRVVTLDKSIATSLLPAEGVSEKDYLKNKLSFHATISLDNSVFNDVCRTPQTWRPMWNTCALAHHWLSAWRGRMLWGCCWMSWAKRTHPSGRPVMAWLIHTMASMVSTLYCTLAHVQEQDFCVCLNACLTFW